MHESCSTCQRIPCTINGVAPIQVEEDCAVGNPTEEDVRAFLDIVQENSKSYSGEDDRIDAINRVLAAYLQVPISRVSINRASTDGTAFGRVPHFGEQLQAPLMNDEGKDRGPGHIQNVLYGVILICEPSREPLRRVSRCPMVLVDIDRYHMSLSGFAFDMHLTCDYLSSSVPLLQQWSSPLMTAAARLLFALRTGVQALKVGLAMWQGSRRSNQAVGGTQPFAWLLQARETLQNVGAATVHSLVPLTTCSIHQEYYLRLTPDTLAPQFGFPYQTSYVDPVTGAVRELRYVLRTARWCFEAVDGGTQEKVWVKFSKRCVGWACVHVSAEHSVH